MADAKPTAAQDIADLTERLGHRFKQPQVLQDALTHPSLAGGKSRRKNAATAYERLEFLGDRVLGLTVAAWLYELFPDASEGELSKRHAGLVNRVTLKKIAMVLELPRFLRVARGEQAAAQRSQTVLSDAIEAVIGALYLDGGIDAARDFIHRHWKSPLEHQNKAEPPADPKTILQEQVQGRGLPLPVYKVVGREGPAHAPRFVIEVTVQGQAPARAEGSSKREAEKLAAAALLGQSQMTSGKDKSTEKSDKEKTDKDRADKDKAEKKGAA